MPKEGDNSIFPGAYVSKQLARKKGSEVRPSNRIRQDTEAREDHRSDLQADTDVPDSPEQQQEQDDLEAKYDCWSTCGSFISPLSRPSKTISFPTQVFLISSGGQTLLLDFLKESRRDDSWNVDCDRQQSGLWTGFIHLIE